MGTDLRASTTAMRDSGARWSGYEQLTGWSIMAVTFASGDVLGLRVFPFSDLAPYRSIWHRDPRGAWSVYVDGPALEVGCPRWWGPALDSARLASVEIEWTASSQLRVAMGDPAVDWQMTLSERPMERLMNLAGRPMPRWSWRPRALRAPREWMARWALGMGRVRIDGTAPAGMPIVMVPERIYGIERSTATWAGRDLGEAVTAPSEPSVGDFRFPVRGVLAAGDFRARVLDADEHQALRERFGPRDGD